MIWLQNFQNTPHLASTVSKVSKAGSLALMAAASFCGALAEQKIERTAGTAFPKKPGPFASKKQKSHTPEGMKCKSPANENSPTAFGNKTINFVNLLFFFKGIFTQIVLSQISKLNYLLIHQHKF